MGSRQGFQSGIVLAFVVLGFLKYRLYSNDGENQMVTMVMVMMVTTAMMVVIADDDDDDDDDDGDDDDDDDDDDGAGDALDNSVGDDTG